MAEYLEEFHGNLEHVVTDTSNPFSIVRYATSSPRWATNRMALLSSSVGDLFKWCSVWTFSILKLNTQEFIITQHMLYSIKSIFYKDGNWRWEERLTFGTFVNVDQEIHPIPQILRPIFATPMLGIPNLLHSGTDLSTNVPFQVFWLEANMRVSFQQEFKLNFFDGSEFCFETDAEGNVFNALATWMDFDSVLASQLLPLGLREFILPYWES